MTSTLKCRFCQNNRRLKLQRQCQRRQAWMYQGDRKHLIPWIEASWDLFPHVASCSRGWVKDLGAHNSDGIGSEHIAIAHHRIFSSFVSSQVSPFRVLPLTSPHLTAALCFASPVLSSPLISSRLFSSHLISSRLVSSHLVSSRLISYHLISLPIGI